jgi:hypothetical protein
MAAEEGKAPMAKDSDKLAVLHRRKTELDHALKHGFSAIAIERRAEKVRAAAIAVIKKYRGPFAHVEGGPGSQEWKELNERWNQFSTAEIITLVHRWPSSPTIRDVRLTDSPKNC